MAIKIKGLTRIKDKEKVFVVLMNAFEEYPKLSKAFPVKERRLLAVEATVRFYGAYDMRYGRAFSLDESCKEAVVIVHSDKNNQTKWRHILAGSYSKNYKNVIEKLTEEERQRRVALFAEMEVMENDMVFPKPHLYIDFLGVKQDFQRQGRGKAIMEKVLAYADEERLPIMLFTNTPEDVRFYQGLGFKIVGITSSKEFQFINTYLVRS